MATDWKTEHAHLLEGLTVDQRRLLEQAINNTALEGGPITAELVDTLAAVHRGELDDDAALARLHRSLPPTPQGD